MAKAVQKRTLETHARLLAAAEEIINDVGFEALRVEEVVLRAGTAKGTFFAHFKDKDTLMERIIGPRIDALLDQLEERPDPQTPEEMTEALTPLCEFMTCERYVFGVILRYSGAAGISEIGAIAKTFDRQVRIFVKWFNNAPFRQDVSAEMLAEGVQAFMTQTMALKFCALHGAHSISEQLGPYLRAWLLPTTNSFGK